MLMELPYTLCIQKQVVLDLEGMLSCCSMLLLRPKAIQKVHTPTSICYGPNMLALLRISILYSNQATLSQYFFPIFSHLMSIRPSLPRREKVPPSATESKTTNLIAKFLSPLMSSNLKQSKIYFPVATHPRSLSERKGIEQSVTVTEVILEDPLTNINGIGYLCNKTAPLTDDQKYEFCCNVWRPDAKFVVPESILYWKERKFSFS